MRIPGFPVKEYSYSKQEAMRWFYGYLKKYTWRIVIGLILGTATSVLAVVNPNITGHIVDDVIGDGTDIHFELLPRFIILMLTVTLVRGACRLVYLYMFERSSQDLLYDMRDGVYRSLMQKDFSFYEWAPERDGMIPIRLVTAWGTKDSEVEAFLERAKTLLA